MTLLRSYLILCLARVLKDCGFGANTENPDEDFNSVTFCCKPAPANSCDVLK